MSSFTDSSGLIDPSVQSALLLISLLCLGLWVITFKVQAGRWRFELFTVDFALGLFLFSLLAAVLLGNFGTDLPFNDRLLVSSRTAQAMMIVAGFIFGVGNTLLLGAVSLLGIAGSFGIGGSIAIVVGAALTYPSGNSTSLPTGAGLLITGVVLSVLACRLLEPKQATVKGKPLGPIKLRRSTKGILVAVLGGTAIGCSYPLALRGAFNDFGLGPYAGLFLFSTGVLIINLVFSLYFFNIALEGGALYLGAYFRNWPAKHLLGIVGGIIWGAGALSVLLARTAGGTISPRSYIPLGSAPLAILLGLVWREFRKAPGLARALMVGALALLTAGSVVLAFGFNVR